MVLPLGGWIGLILRNQLTESKKLLRNKRDMRSGLSNHLCSPNWLLYSILVNGSLVPR